MFTLIIGAAIVAAIGAACARVMDYGRENDLINTEGQK